MPDLVAEIDRSASSSHKLAPYFRMGVREAWTWSRRDGAHLWVPDAASARQLRESHRSRVLPGLRRDDLEGLLDARSPFRCIASCPAARPCGSARHALEPHRGPNPGREREARIPTEPPSMNEETFNLQIRKFLKKVGVTSQREIEKAVRDAIASGVLAGDEKVRASVTLKLPDLGVELDIDDDIALD